METGKNLNALTEKELEKIAGGAVGFAIEDFLNLPTEDEARRFLESRGFSTKGQEHFDTLMTFWRSNQ